MKIDVAEVVVADLSHKTANLITETLVSQGSKCSRLNKSGGTCICFERGDERMTYCKECGHKLGFFEHAADGLCHGCRQRLAQLQAEQAHARALAPYTSTDLPVITVEGAILKRGESAHYATPTALKEIKTVSLGYSGGSRGVSIPLPLKIGAPRSGIALASHADTW